jgi:hypothetical protein
MEDPKTLVTLEHKAASGDHNAEMALIHHVADLYRTGELGAVAQNIRTATYHEHGQEAVLDFSDMTLHRRPDGSIAAVRRDAGGRVAEIIHDDEQAYKFEYYGDSPNFRLDMPRQHCSGQASRLLVCSALSLHFILA